MSKPEKMLVQCKLTNGPATMTAWLDAAKGPKVGNFVTLKNVDGLWRVEKVGKPRSAGDINRGWDNNI